MVDLYNQKFQGENLWNKRVSVEFAERYSGAGSG